MCAYAYCMSHFALHCCSPGWLSNSIARGAGAGTSLAMFLGVGYYRRLGKALPVPAVAPIFWVPPVLRSGAVGVPPTARGAMRRTRSLGTLRRETRSSHDRSHGDFCGGGTQGGHSLSAAKCVIGIAKSRVVKTRLRVPITCYGLRMPRLFCQPHSKSKLDVCPDRG